MSSIEPILIEEIRAARERIRASVTRTPLVRLEVDGAPAEIWLKLENLQPIGSFKLRGAGNAMARSDPAQLARGVYTASAGNMAQGVAWNARRLGVPCRVVVPDHAPRAKLDPVERLGAEVIQVPFDEWWQVLVDHHYPGLDDGLFIHPVANRDVIAGNGTIGLEIVEDLPDVDAIVIPFGGGGLSCGIASAVRGLAAETRGQKLAAGEPGPATSDPASMIHQHPSFTQIYACEVETATPLAASLATGEPQQVDYTASFVDGIGGKSILPEMWPLVQQLIHTSLVVSLAETAAAVRTLLTRNRVVSEGAGAASVAAALAGRAGRGKVVCVVSGGNIDPAKLATIIDGRIP